MSNTKTTSSPPKPKAGRPRKNKEIEASPGE